MKQLKKTILTLVALLAVTTGAWADETPLVTINSTDYNSTGYKSFTSGSKTFDDKVTVTFSNSVSNDGDHWGWYADDTSSLLTVAGINGYTITSCKFYTFEGTAKTGYTVAGESPSVYLSNDKVYTDANQSVDLGKFGISKIEVYGGVAPSATDPNAVTALEIDATVYSGWSSVDEKLLKASELPGFQTVTEDQAKSWTGAPSTGTVELFYEFVADGQVKAVRFVNGVYDSSFMEEDLERNLIWEDIKYNDAKYFYTTGPASSGPKVDWDKDKKTGTFKMPGGNVTLEPEYYPQAALTAAPSAINDVPATTDGAIVSAGTVANIGETTTAQGTVMYYVSPTALDDDALLALAADQWTADVPTAAGLAQGQAYVYYYVRGNDGDTDAEIFSDGDILATNALTVTIAAEPTYAVTFAEGVNPEPPAEPEWTASPNAGVTKGETVTVTYTGSKKVIGVKAEKKAAAPAAAEGHALSASVVGEIVGTDGKAYAVADKDNLPTGVTAVAIVAYKSATAGSSLAITLADVGRMDWSSAKSTCEGKTAIGGNSWKLPTLDEWKQMFSANGGNEGSCSGLNSAITTAGGTALHEWGDFYWTSSEGGDEGAWKVRLETGVASWFCLDDTKEDATYVRACLAF